MRRFNKLISNSSMLDYKRCIRCGVLASCVRLTPEGRLCAQCEEIFAGRSREGGDQHTLETPYTRLRKEYSYSDTV